MPIDADALVSRGRQALSAPEPAQALEALLLETIASPPADVRRALLGDAASPADAAGARARPLGMRVLLDSPELTIFHASLPPGFVNAPHDHRAWAVVAVYEGEERNVFYERRGGTIVPASELVASAPRVVVMRDDVIHAIENRLTRPSYAIHAYGNAHFHVARSMWHPETLAEEPRDEKVFHGWCREMIARGVRLPVLEG